MSAADRPRAGPSALFRFAAVLYLLLAVAGLVWLGAGRESLPLVLFVGRAWWAEVALGLAAGGAFVVSWRGVRRLSPLARALDAKLEEVLAPLGADEALGLAVLSGVAEEVFFRGAMQHAWGFWPATLVFALLHTGRGRELVLWFVAALVVGAALGVIMLWREALLAPVVAHATINAVELRRHTAARRGPSEGATGS